MKTEFLLEKKGLDEAGKSVLTTTELIKHLSNARTLSLLDAAANGLSTGDAFLDIRAEGTFAVLPDRPNSAGSGVTTASAYLRALEQHALSPDETTAQGLDDVEQSLDETCLRCLKAAVTHACTSDTNEFKVLIGDQEINIRMPHKSTILAYFRNKNLPTTRNIDLKLKVTTVRQNTDAISTTGFSVLLSNANLIRKIKIGDKILVALRSDNKTFLRLKQEGAEDHEA